MKKMNRATAALAAALLTVCSLTAYGSPGAGGSTDQADCKVVWNTVRVERYPGKFPTAVGERYLVIKGSAQGDGCLCAGCVYDRSAARSMVQAINKDYGFAGNNELAWEGIFTVKVHLPWKVRHDKGVLSAMQSRSAWSVRVLEDDEEPVQVGTIRVARDSFLYDDVGTFIGFNARVSGTPGAGVVLEPWRLGDYGANKNGITSYCPIRALLDDDGRAEAQITFPATCGVNDRNYIRYEHKVTIAPQSMWQQ